MPPMRWTISLSPEGCDAAHVWPALREGISMRFDEEIRAGFRACRRGIWAVGLFSLVLNLLMLTQPLYMTQVYDRVLSSRSEETLLMLTVVAVGALALIGILEIVRQIVLMRTGARLETALGGRMLDASLQTAQRGGPDVQS